MEQQQSSTNTRSGKRVLIVDDNEICRLALEPGLGNCGLDRTPLIESLVIG